LIGEALAHVLEGNSTLDADARARCR